ncbi:hypothetical protein [Burkholderia plantarii]|uniref:hypothetical protein n=1 Tax=Burkholderia plantarii TaxID=41899 RepID=UPI00114CC8A5|nr:hypothetical protein [Burkholderia plantarii]
MSHDLTPQEAIERSEQHFGSREEMLAHTLTILSASGQPTDVTFYRRRPILDVRVSTKLAAARFYGLDSILPSLLTQIEFSNGATAGLNEIWTVNPMPAEGFSKADLDAVDLTEGDQRAGPRGETIRKMISDTYHCTAQSEVDYFLRRFIAS